MVYICLTGQAVTDVLKDVGIKIGEKTLEAAIKKIPGSVLTKINQRIGFRLITKFGEKGAINLGKLVPVVGGVIGGSVDAASTIGISKSAYNVFIKTKPSLIEEDGIIAEYEEIEIVEDQNK